MSKTVDVCVVGAGASGIIAAITAARGGAEVVLVDGNAFAGKKLLSTGNGRCNFLNEYQGTECYRTRAPSEAAKVLNHLPKEKVLSFFDDIGIAVMEKNGYYYPYTNRAKDVRDCLDMEINRLGIHTVFSSVVLFVKKDNIVFNILAKGGDSNRTIRAGRCIIATGGMAFPKSGSDGSGYDIVRSFGHSVIPPLPALTELYSDKRKLYKWTGVRTHASVRLMADGDEVAFDVGEIQLTARGISGIPVFNISRYASKLLGAGNKINVIINFLPGMSREDAACMLNTRFLEKSWGKTVIEAMRGLIEEKLAAVILERAGIGPMEESVGLSPMQMAKIVDACCNFSVDITGTGDFSKAQTTAGGVPLTEVFCDTLESRFCKGLYICGELLDVDGRCGGYNLTWAWASGFTCGCACRAVD